MSRGRERWVGWRNRLLANADFQRWAARFPLTRSVARGRARGLFDLTAGFVYSQVLAACIELGLLEMLVAGPLTTAEIAARLDLPPAAATRLLVAAEALGLVEELGAGRYALGAEGAALRGNPGVADMVRHHRMLYADMADPVAFLRRGQGGGALAGYWPYATGQEGDAGAYSTLMAVSQPMIARQVLAAYSFGRHRALLDIGGGEGKFVGAVAERHPELTLTVFDLPEVAARARLALDGRATVVGGSFIDDPLPVGADLITLVRILHDHDDAVAQALLVKITAALPVGGRLLIAEPMAGTPGAKGVGAYFSAYLWAMGSGRPRTSAEIGEMLTRAGLGRWREHRTDMPLIARVIVAGHSKV